MWCIYMMEDSSAIKKNDMSFVAIWMDLEMIILSEVRQRQIYDITYRWNKKPQEMIDIWSRFQSAHLKC